MQAESIADQPDLVLLTQFIETGDPRAFAEIVTRYARVVYSASVRILGDDAKAQDVSQETFFRLMRQPRIVTHSLGGWLHRSATHLAMDARRSERSRKLREHTYTAEQQSVRTAEPSWAEVSPYVDEALNAVQEPTRSLLIRHFLQGTPQADLAVEFGTSPATISRRVKAGIEQLQQQLRKKGIYIGVVALGGFCLTNTTEAAPVAFVTELGKMHMVASFAETGAATASPTPSYPAARMRPRPLHVPLSKLTVVGLSVVVAGYIAAVILTWDHGNPTATPSQNTARVESREKAILP